MNRLVQSFDFLAGIDIQISQPKRPSSFFGINQKTVVSFIASVGASNPLTSQDSAQIFQVPKAANGTDDDPAFIALFPEAKGKTNIAFVPSERSRFYRQYYGGLRFKTFYYDNNGAFLNRSPAFFDLTVGQNESITNRLTDTILRVDGFYPFPVRNADYIYLFGGAQLKLGRQPGENSIPFILAPATSITIPNNNTGIVQVSDSPFLRSGRDRYSFGVGIDFIKLFKRISETPPTAP